MESLITLLKIVLYIYLGLFTYISYQILFYYHKKFILIKTFSFFFFIALLIIKISNKYNITFFVGYLFFYMLGIYLSRLFLKPKIHKNTKLVKYFLIIPLKNKFFLFVRKSIFFDSIIKLKEYIKLYFYYKKFPYKKPKTIYELF